MGRTHTTVFLAVTLCSVAAAAGDWRITPRVSIQENYSDNIDLAPKGEEKSDFVTEVNPGVTVTGRGARTDLSLVYTLQHVRHKREENEDRTNHQLQATSDTEVIDQVLFVNARATARQENVNDRGRLAVDNVTVSENRDTVYTFALTPTFRHHFGKYADTQVTTPYDWVESGADNDASTSGSLNASVTSGRYFAKTPWSLSYSTRTLDNGEGQGESTFESLSGRLTYVFDRRFSAFVTLGYSDNDTGNADLDRNSATRGVGLNWNPSPRTSFSGGYEEQPAGDSVFFDFQHRQRRTVWSASLSQSLTTSRDLQLERELIPLEDPFGEPIETPEGEIVLVPVDTVRQTDGVIASRDFRGSVALRGRRTTYQASVNRNERDGFGNDDSVSSGVTASISHTLSRKLSANLNGSWQESTFEPDDVADTTWRMNLALSYRIFSDVSGRLSLSRVERETDDDTGDYTENRVTAGLSVTF
jgi:uncharacterized protein (PEP-CTERM system associated)